MALWNDAISQCNAILALIEDEVPGWAWDKSSEFFEGIKERVVSMQEWIEQKEHVTAKMLDALDNMERGVRSWIQD